MGAVNAVTTFSPEGYELYGRKCIASFVKYWPADVGLYIFIEKPLDIGNLIPICRSNIHVKDLADETDILSFLADFSWHPRMNHPTDYRFQGIRFAHKVFAMTAPCLPNDGIRVWLDADTETTKPIDRDYLARCFPSEDEICAYLGRTQWHHSETGWLAFDLDKAGVVVLNGLRHVYISGQIATLNETHDAWAFDFVRAGLLDTNLKFKNLSPNAVGLDAWRYSPLGERMIHRKGGLKTKP